MNSDAHFHVSHSASFLWSSIFIFEPFHIFGSVLSLNMACSDERGENRGASRRDKMMNNALHATMIEQGLGPPTDV